MKDAIVNGLILYIGYVTVVVSVHCHDLTQLASLGLKDYEINFTVMIVKTKMMLSYLLLNRYLF